MARAVAMSGLTTSSPSPSVLTSRSPGASASRPEGFELERFWEDAVARFEVGAPTRLVTMRATGRARAALRRRGFDAAEPDPELDGGLPTVTVAFDGLETAVWELLPLGGEVAVSDPAEVRDRLARLGRELAAVYPE